MRGWDEGHIGDSQFKMTVSLVGKRRQHEKWTMSDVQLNRSLLD